MERATRAWPVQEDLRIIEDRSEVELSCGDSGEGLGVLWGSKGRLRDRLCWSSSIAFGFRLGVERRLDSVVLASRL